MSTIMTEGKKTGQRTVFCHSTYQDVPVYDLRYMPRWKTNKKAFYRMCDFPVVAKTEIIDLNIEGVCLYVAEDVHPSQQLDIKIYLSDKVSFETTGIVVWKCSRPHGRFLAGVLFDKLPDETQEMILEYAFDDSDLTDFCSIA